MGPKISGWNHFVTMTSKLKRFVVLITMVFMLVALIKTYCDIDKMHVNNTKRAQSILVSNVPLKNYRRRNIEN